MIRQREARGEEEGGSKPASGGATGAGHRGAPLLRLRHTVEAPSLENQIEHRRRRETRGTLVLPQTRTLVEIKILKSYGIHNPKAKK